MSLRRNAIGALALALAVSAGAFLNRELVSPGVERSRFELASELASSWELALEARLEAIYGSGTVDASVCVELDDAERESERVELDPSTAIAVDRGSGGHLYEASREREHLRERSPRLRSCRVALRVDPRVALPADGALRQATEIEREALREELAGFVRAIVPLAGADGADPVEIVLRAAPSVGEAAPTAGAFSDPRSAAALALGLALLLGAAILAWRRHRSRELATRAEASTPSGIERVRASAARHPTLVARVLSSWCTGAHSAAPAAEPGTPAAAALVVAELGAGLTSAVLGAMDRETIRTLALALEARPLVADASEIETCAERLAGAVESAALTRELEAADLLELCRGALPGSELCALEQELAAAREERARGAALAKLGAMELGARLEALPAGEALACAAALPHELSSRWLAALEPASRGRWIERLQSAPEPSAGERARLLNELLASARVPSAVHGDERVARIVALWPAELRREALQGIAERDAEAAARVREHLIALPDLARLSADDLRTLLSGLELGELALALVQAPREVEAAIESALTPRVRTRLAEERALQESAPRSARDDARERLVGALRELFERGEIELAPPPEHAEARR